jgi:hypothetical protein
MTRIGNTFEGQNGSFTSIYYKRAGEWFPGVRDNQTGKRTYSACVRDSWCAATAAMDAAQKAAGEGARLVLPARPPPNSPRCTRRWA